MATCDPVGPAVTRARQTRAGRLTQHLSGAIQRQNSTRASLLQILFSARSERQLMEQMQYNLLFRWFVGLGVDEPVWVPTVFTKNRDRLLSTEMSRKVMAAILAHREVAPLLSDDHSSVDGTLIKAWASMKSFQPTVADTPSDDDPGSPPGPESPTEAPLNRRRPRSTQCPAPPASTAMQKSTSGVRSGPIPPTPRPPILTPGFNRLLKKSALGLI